LGDLEPKGFFLRKFHFERLETESSWSGLGDARGIRWAVNGLLAGITVAAMPFVDWPAGAGFIVFNGPASLGGIAFSAAGLLLATFSLFMIIRRANIKEAIDNERLVGCDGDLAP
jgi:hypothetical protein